MSGRLTTETKQKRLQELVDTCGQQRGDTVVLVFENQSRSSNPFAMWGRDGVPYTRIFLNGLETEGWLIRKGSDSSRMSHGDREFKGTSFHLTEEGQEMLDLRRFLL